MPRLNPVPSGKIALGAKWFRDIVARVEEIKPIDGRFIVARTTSDGTFIDLSDDLQVIELSVCINGQVSTIKVLALNP